MLNNYATCDPLATAARAAILVSLVLGYPLTFVSLRDSVLELSRSGLLLLGKKRGGKQQTGTAVRAEATAATAEASAEAEAQAQAATVSGNGGADTEKVSSSADSSDGGSGGSGGSDVSSSSGPVVVVGGDVSMRIKDLTSLALLAFLTTSATFLRNLGLVASLG